jgi:1-phosphatidylinositol-4-phosphate 5-kinase
LGTERWANGNNFEGQFKDGYKDGKGKFAWQNGATYDGDFKIGYMWGRGTLRKGNGIYEG